MEKVMITGGSRGIGAAAVRAFASAGYAVCFLYRQQHAQAEALARETGAEALCADVTDSAAVARAFAAAGDVDLLINNAGIAHFGLLRDIGHDQWRHIFDVNVHGMYYCIEAALPAMLRRQRGCIINVSSMWGQVGASCEVAYSASKGAVIAMSQALAKELGPSHIRVNCIAPGVILTDMCRSLDAQALQALREETPLEALGTPEDVADAMLYLARAEFVTGQVLAVNGGFVI